MANSKSFIDKHLVSTTSFRDNMKSMRDSSLNFENCSYLERYKNPKVKYMESSELNLVYFRNIIQERYLDRLMLGRRATKITKEQEKEFDQNPYLAAYKLLNNADYWWLILLVNKKMNVQSFTKLDSFIYTPNMEDVKAFMTKELNKNREIGVLI